MPFFSLLTINSFGLPFFLGWQRINALSRELNNRDETVLCLQEIQQGAYLPILGKHLTDFPHQFFKKNAYAPMGGLVTASRLPFVRSESLPFPDRGKWLSLGFADWALQKGVLVTGFNVDGLQVVVLNTHLHANYMGKWHKENALAKIQSNQVQYLAEQARAQPEDALVVVCGDFNFPRNTFLYDELIQGSGFVDPLKDDPRPTYRAVSLMASKWSVALDFVLVRKPVGKDVSVVADVMAIENSTARYPVSRFLSDHCALTLSATWR